MENQARIIKLEEKVKYLEEKVTSSAHEITELKGTVQLYQVSATHVKNKLDAILNALKGDEMGSPGIVKRMGIIEENSEKLSIIVSNLNNWMQHAKSYAFGIIAGAGTVAGVIYWIVQNFMEWIK